MKGKTMNTFSHLILPLLLGLVVAVIVFAAIYEKNLPLISTPRASLIALLVVGMVLGIILLVIIISGLAGWKLPLIANQIQAIKAVGILIAVKFVIGTAGFFFHWL